jgi:hypothetical protein
MLIRAIAKSLEDTDYDFFLLFPNEKAEPIFKRADYKYLGMTKKYMRVFNVTLLLTDKTPIPIFLSKLISPALNQLVKLIYPDTWFFNLGRFETKTTKTLDFETQYLSSLYHQNCFATDKTKDYLKWKYENTPGSENIFFYIIDTSQRVVGCIVFCVEASNNVQIREILHTQEPSILEALLGLFFKHIKKFKYEYAYALIYENSSILTSSNYLDLTISDYRRKVFYITNPSKSTEAQLNDYLHSPFFNLFASDQDN